MLFDAFTVEENTLFEKICKVRKYQSGQEIVSEGDEGGSLLLIRKGRAEVRKTLDSSNYKCLKELDPGDFFGEMSFLNQISRSASVIALEDCEILEVMKTDFDVLAQSNLDIGLKIYRSIAQELALRLKRNNEDLKKAVLLAIEGTDLL